VSEQTAPFPRIRAPRGRIVYVVDARQSSSTERALLWLAVLWEAGDTVFAFAALGLWIAGGVAIGSTPLTAAGVLAEVLLVAYVLVGARRRHAAPESADPPPGR
jgi:hypothetical protein